MDLELNCTNNTDLPNLINLITYREWGDSFHEEQEEILERNERWGVNGPQKDRSQF